MKKYIISYITLISAFILILFCSSCRDWIINVDGYELHLINDKYYIAQIPQENLPTKYVIPIKIGEYEIYGFGSNKNKSILGGAEEIALPRVKNLYVPKEIKSILLFTISKL